MTPTSLTLGSFGLHYEQSIRWRREAGQRWREGYALGINDDGSLRIKDQKTGSIRNLLVGRADLEWEDRGPRGGIIWHPVEQVE